jgi:uncharacterized protein (DUF924 family)
MTTLPAVATSVLQFWFGGDAPGEGAYGQQRRVWFKKDPAFDAAIRDRFLDDYEQAAAGGYDPWRSQPRSTLALLLLLDQFPRNLFRGEGRSYATDAYARQVTNGAIAQGFDALLLPVERVFLYLPLEHSEDPEDQARSVQYFEQLVAVAPDLASTLDYAYRHQAVIDRFGRFPHRNAILGRASTPEELAFLQQPGSRF